MNEVKETTILQEGLVKVTNLRTIIGTQTFPISDIASVNLTKQAKSYRSLLVVFVGILLIAWAVIDETTQFREFFNIGIFLAVIGIVLFMVARPTYAVQIGSASGETTILSSTDKSFIQKIVMAMNNAIGYRA
jgi:Family of unknown function (DUF6232)